MDVDDNDDVDGKLARQFSLIGTRDRDTLIDDFRQVLNAADDGLLKNGGGGGDNFDKQTCVFFLDMNNWNLQAAVGSFYDYNAAEMLETPSMSFVADVTIGEGESVAPATKFLKTWRVRNGGLQIWPRGCVLKRCSGDAIRSATDEIAVPSVPSDHCTDISVEMISPATKGTYHSMWRLMTRQEVPFGDHIWCIITVEESGLLDLTQKLAATHCTEEDSNNNNNNDENFTSFSL